MGLVGDARTHDLLRLAPGARLLDAAGNVEASPPWVIRALRRRPWVVVRRDVRPEGRVPVGVRGDLRRFRHGTWIERADVVDRVTPEDLALSGRPGGRWAVALQAVAVALGPSDLLWGPVGSVGFELATETAATGVMSDLDLLVRAPFPIPDGGASLAGRLGDVTRRLGVRLDCLLETPAGGVHLHDLVGDGPVLARTDRGARLVLDPWDPAQGRVGRARA